MTSQAPISKVQHGAGSFLISDIYETIINSQTLIRRKTPKDLKKRPVYNYLKTKQNT